MKNLENLTDTNLVLAYQSGNKKALNALVKKWHLQFCKFAFWVVKDADVAKDIAQESWRVIFDSLTYLKDPTKFKSWAISIVNRKSIDYLRSNQRRTKSLKKYHQEQFRGNLSEDNGDITIYKEKIKEAIAVLPKNQKIAIELFYKQCYSLKEIAELLNISVGTAKSRLFHAREKLKLIIKK